MKPRIERLLIALMFALLAAGVTLIVANAQDSGTSSSPTTAQQSPDCTVCHTEFEMTWQTGRMDRQVVTRSFWRIGRSKANQAPVWFVIPLVMIPLLQPSKQME
jgi:hypothetical protein